jgi:hypothetical protein
MCTAGIVPVSMMVVKGRNCVRSKDTEILGCSLSLLDLFFVGMSKRELFQLQIIAEYQHQQSACMRNSKPTLPVPGTLSRPPP